MKLPESRAGRASVVVLAVAMIAAPAAAVGAAVAHQDNTKAAKQAIIGGKARNVILLIGDGMGDSEITIARNYQVGAAGRLALDTLPLTGAYTTYSVYKDDPTKPDYDPESASTGSAWATGHKTYDGAISVTPDGKPKPTVLELAKAAGFRTGDVSTAEIQDATPAVLVSHVAQRACKGPDLMATCPIEDKVNGGVGSISEQLVKTRPDVALGGGKEFFDQTVKAGRYSGLTVLQQAQVSGYQVVTDAAGLASATSNKPILGLFAKNNLDLEWVGPKPTLTGTEPSRCEVNTARTATQPHLSDMAAKAISVLDRQTKGAKKGFFLQIEGASIDKQDHAANPCGQIGETVEFDKAVKLALAYQKKNPDTLVIATADHAHTSQIVEAGSTTMGYTATLTTNEGSDMTISYATAPITGSQQHTGSELRVAAGGPQAANVLGVTDQTELFYTMTRALGVK